jgi:hypothetical protein
MNMNTHDINRNKGRDFRGPEKMQEGVTDKLKKGDVNLCLKNI